LLVLAYLRKGETFAELAAGFGVGTLPPVVMLSLLKGAGLPRETTKDLRSRSVNGRANRV
jgi:hypothetical protein